MTQYGATPQWMDSRDDDGEKIQKAIDDSCNPTSHLFGRTVFVPHGEYGIARPLDLRGGCAVLIGAGTHSTSLATLPRPSDACWPSGDTSGAILASVRDVRGQGRSGASIVRTAAKHLTLVSDFNLAVAHYCPFLDLRDGALLLRDVGTSGGMTPPLYAGMGSVPSRGAPALSADMISPLLLHSFQRGFIHRSVDGAGSALTPISVGNSGTPTGGTLSPQYTRHRYTHSLHAQLTHILCMRRDGLPRCAVPTPLHKPLSSCHSPYSHSLTRPARRN